MFLNSTDNATPVTLFPTCDTDTSPEVTVDTTVRDHRTNNNGQTQAPPQDAYEEVQATDFQPTFALGGDPSQWSPQEWSDAMKANPAKYCPMFLEAISTGKVSDEVKDASGPLTNLCNADLMKYQEGIQAASQVMKMMHELQMAMIRNI